MQTIVNGLKFRPQKDSAGVEIQAFKTTKTPAVTDRVKSKKVARTGVLMALSASISQSGDSVFPSLFSSKTTRRTAVLIKNGMDKRKAGRYGITETF